MLKNLLLHVFKKISAFIYSTLGPAVSFKLAMSPLGKSIFRIVTRGKTSITIKTKYDFLINLRMYEYLMSGFFFLRETNPYETKVLRETLKNGDIFFDIGAHIGWYSLNAAQIVGKKGKVIAFEPNSNCIADLKRNKELNKFDNITIEEIAITDKNTRSDFWIGDDMGGSLIQKNTMRLTIDKKIKKITVSAQTLDDYCKEHNIKKISLIKIDVEGAEMRVLRGAKITLKNLYPDIIIEWVDITFQADNTSKMRLINFFSAYGYYPYTFTSSGLKSYSLGQQQKTINIYFSKKIFH